MQVPSRTAVSSGRFATPIPWLGQNPTDPARVHCETAMMIRRLSSDAVKLVLVVLLCVSVGCATSRAPAPSAEPDPKAEPASSDSAPADPPKGATVDTADNGVPPAADSGSDDPYKAKTDDPDDDAAKKKPQTK